MNKREMNYLFIYIIAFAVVIATLLIRGVVGIAQAIELIITFALVMVTIIYAKRTAEIADETKKARFAALRPIVVIAWVGSDSKEITASFKNIGPGPALNLECYLTHDNFSFKYKHDKYSVLEVGESHQISFPSESFEFQQWTSFVINCDYESVYKKPMRSVLKFTTQEERSLITLEL